MQIFTFDDSLRIQTYDRLTNQIIRTECYKIKITPKPAYGYFFIIDVEFDGLSNLNDPNNNVKVGDVPINILSCDSTEHEFIVFPYCQMVSERFSINNYFFNDSDEKIQIFTFGDSLQIQTIQWFGGKILETKFYSYKPIENEPSSFWVYLSNCKVKFKADSPIKSQYEITILHDRMIEFEYSSYNIFEISLKIEEKKYRIEHLENKIPMVYSIIATKIAYTV
jgi:hypothetical protein